MSLRFCGELTQLQGLFLWYSLLTQFWLNEWLWGKVVTCSSSSISSGIASLPSWLFFFSVFPPEVQIISRPLDDHGNTKCFGSNTKTTPNSGVFLLLSYPELPSLPLRNLLDIKSAYSLMNFP
jgi:hypothetical protein